MNFVSKYGAWALIAGASVGLGACFAREAAQRGFNVVLVARRQGALDETAAGIRRDFGVQTLVIVADLARADIGEVVGAQIRDLDLGLFIYNAAAEPMGPFLDTPMLELMNNIAVNCVTPTVLTILVGKGMRERRRGAIVMVTSIAALQGLHMFVHYGAAKSYELILGEGLWEELRPYGVDALAYVVGSTATPQYLQTPRNESAPTDGLQTEPPLTPEVVAANLYSLLDQGPRQHSNPNDAERMKRLADQPRAEYVTLMGQLTKHIFEQAKAEP